MDTWTVDRIFAGNISVILTYVIKYEISQSEELFSELKNTRDNFANNVTMYAVLRVLETLIENYHAYEKY